ncbi:MAG: DUF2637 domain-containing protein [Anaerolineae bacterium]|nr:DUF2637 domain-containing protein [Anaerolineae bacterium]
MIKRLNDLVIQSADNLPAALFLLILVYVMGELHNYTAMRDFAQAAGVPWLLSYLTPVMVGVFILVIYWILVAYKAQGFNTVLPWLVIIVFIAASFWLNLLHFGTAADGVAIAALPPALIFFGGWLAKDIIGKQVSRNRVIQTLKDLLNDAQAARAELHKLTAEIAEQKAAQDAQQKELLAQREALENEINALRTQREAFSMATIDDVPAELVQAIQADALMAAGMNKAEGAKFLGIHRNTFSARLDLVNGTSLCKGKGA